MPLCRIIAIKYTRIFGNALINPNEHQNFRIRAKYARKAAHAERTVTAVACMINNRLFSPATRHFSFWLLNLPPSFDLLTLCSVCTVGACVPTCVGAPCRVHSHQTIQFHSTPFNSSSFMNGHDGLLYYYTILHYFAMQAFPPSHSIPFHSIQFMAILIHWCIWFHFFLLNDIHSTAMLTNITIISQVAPCIFANIYIFCYFS